MKFYSLNLHGKQGDDFNSCIEYTNGNVSEALKLWEQRFLYNANVCSKLAKAFNGLNITIEADNQMISLYSEDIGIHECLEIMSKEGLLDFFEDEE